MKARCLSLIFVLLALTSTKSQNYFGASHFLNSESPSPFVIGQGFHINDPTKPTFKCFTPESSNLSHLLPVSAGKKTSIKIYRTFTEDDYRKLRKSGVSGKVTFFNLLSFGGGYNKEYQSDEYGYDERIVIQANVNFGAFKYENNLVLLPEAQQLITDGREEDFINKYGTHFISGIEKQNTLWVIIANKQKSFATETSNGNTSGAGFQHNIGLNFEASESDVNSVFSSKQEYNVDIDADGAEIDPTLEKKILDILQNTGGNKLAEIKLAVANAQQNLNSAEQAAITGYFYTSFEMYQLKTLKWNTKKEKILSNINEAIIQTFDARKSIGEITNPNALDKFQKEINVLPEFPEKKFFLEKIKSEYLRQSPDFISYKKLIDASLNYLQNRYNKCADIYCEAGTGCCEETNDLTDVYTIISKIETRENKLFRILNEAEYRAVDYDNKPPCEKQAKGIVNIISLSSNPYDIYVDNTFLETLGGGQTGSYLVKPGSYLFKAVQKSGYVMYSTVNNRQLTIDTICQQVSAKIGFED